MIPALGYIRVSSEQQANDTRSSLDDQRAAIAALASRVGATLVDVFEDPGISGATIAKRPGLTALIARCKADARRLDAPGYVFVLNDSRLGRFDDPDEAAHLRVELKRVGWIVKFAEADDIADPSLRHIMRAVGSAQASEYRRNLRANSTRGRKGATMLGFWTTRPPLGYAREVVYPPERRRVLAHGMRKGPDEKIKLTPGADSEVQLVRDLFAMYSTGAYSLRALERWARTQVPGPGARALQWSVTVLRVILQNQAYLGHIPGRSRTAARMELGDWARRAPEYVVRDTHPPLIDHATFDAVQHQLSQMPARGAVADYRVRGLVTCVHCGEPYVGGGLGSTLADGTRTRYYIDAGGREKRCGPPAGCVSKHILERGVIDGLATHVAGQITPSMLRKAFAELLGANPTQDPKAATTRALAQASTRRDNLIAGVESGTLFASEVVARLASVRDEIARLEATLAATPAPSTPAALTASLDTYVALARNTVALARTATGPELQALLRPWMVSMDFDNKTRVLTMRLRTLACLLLPPLRAPELHEQWVIVRRFVIGSGRPRSRKGVVS